MVVGPKHCLWYRNGRVYVSDDVDCSEIYMATDLSGEDGPCFAGHLLRSYKITQRVLRLEPRSCIKAGEGQYCFAYNHKIYIIDEIGRIINSTTIRKEMRNPLQIILLNGIEGFQDTIYYGEYGWNNNRGPVHIMQFNDGVWNPAYTFPQNTICHIHALIPDLNGKCVYILTGDRDNESGIWKATDGFKKVEPIFWGKQKYRTCAGCLKNGELLYATDTPIEKNYLFKTDLQSEPEAIGELPGSVINSIYENDEWWFATAVEQDPDMPKLMHYISSKRGPGIADRYSHLYRMNMTGETREILRFKKDILPMWLFQFGNISFIHNYRDNRIFIYPIAVKKYNQKTLEIKVK